MPRPRISSNTTTRRKRSSQMRLPTKSTRNAARAIEYVMDKNKEMKRSGIYSGVNNYNAAASVAGDIVRTIPSISTGDGDNNRDGRLIKLFKHQMKGCVAVMTGLSLPKIYVDVWMVEDKYQKNFLEADAATAFLVKVNNSFVPTNPGGVSFWEENGFTLNRDRFIIKRKRIALTTSLLPGATSTSLSDQTVPIMRTFTFTRSFKKGRVLQYQTDADVIPSNYNSYIFFSVGSYDESYYGTLSASIIKASVTSTFFYKDK